MPSLGKGFGLEARRTLAPPHYDGVSDMAVAVKKGCFFSASRDRRSWGSPRVRFEGDGGTGGRGDGGTGGGPCVRVGTR